MHGLASFQHAAGHQTAVLMPLYRTVRDEAPDLEPVGHPFRVPLGGAPEEARLFRVAGRTKGPPVYFIEHLDYFNRAGIYGEGGADYPDNARRFAFFALAACLALPRVTEGPVHAARARLAYGARAGVPPDRRSAAEPWAEDAHTVVSIHNPGLSGPLRTGGDVRSRPAPRAVQLASSSSGTAR